MITGTYSNLLYEQQYLRFGDGVEVPHDEAHADVAQAGRAEVVARVQKRSRVVRGDPLLYRQLAQPLSAGQAPEQKGNKIAKKKSRENLSPCRYSQDPSARTY